LRYMRNDDQCTSNWNKVLLRVYRNILGKDRIPDRFLRDPWGSPFLLNENEGEVGLPPCSPDIITSVGHDGIHGTADDIAIEVAPFFCRQ
jgi:hypothetical protein